jgi:hypothetical protein
MAKDTTAKTETKVTSDTAETKKPAETQQAAKASAPVKPVEKTPVKPAETQQAAKAPAKKPTAKAPAKAAEKAPAKKPAAKAPAKKATEKTPAKAPAKKPAAKAPAKAAQPAAKQSKSKLTYEGLVAAADAKLGKVKPSKKLPKIPFNVVLHGAVDGVFYVLIEDGKVDVQPFRYEDSAVDFSISADNFVLLLDGKFKIGEGVAAGTFQISGDMKKAFIAVAELFA